VPDLAEEYARAAFTVAPIYEGGGTKIKVLESLNRGRTVAMMRHSLRGYEHALVHGEDVWVADTDAELAEGCIRLLASPDLRDSLAAHGAIQAQEFSFSRFSEIVKETIERVTADGRGVRRR
jgi:glycosyltransferase involved in cell wall biosynthesis